LSDVGHAHRSLVCTRCHAVVDRDENATNCIAFQALYDTIANNKVPWEKTEWWKKGNDITGNGMGRILKGKGKGKGKGRTMKVKGKGRTMKGKGKGRTMKDKGKRRRNGPGGGGGSQKRRKLSSVDEMDEDYSFDSDDETDEDDSSDGDDETDGDDSSDSDREVGVDDDGSLTIRSRWRKIHPPKLFY